MAESITVDTAALKGAAGAVRGWVEQLETSPLGGSAGSGLVELEVSLSPASVGSAAGELAEAVGAVAGRVVTALQGLAGGLDGAAMAYRQVDGVTGAAAERLAPPR